MEPQWFATTDQEAAEAAGTLCAPAPVGPARGKALIALLEREGVEVIFGYPGGAVLPIYDALHDAKIRHVLVRQPRRRPAAHVGARAVQAVQQPLLLGLAAGGEEQGERVGGHGTAVHGHRIPLTPVARGCETAPATTGAAPWRLGVWLLAPASHLVAHEAAPQGEPRQSRHRVDAELLHQAVAVGLDGAHADPQGAGDLLVAGALGDVPQDLALARA